MYSSGRVEWLSILYTPDRVAVVVLELLLDSGKLASVLSVLEDKGTYKEGKGFQATYF